MLTQTPSLKSPLSVKRKLPLKYTFPIFFLQLPSDPVYTIIQNFDRLSIIDIHLTATNVPACDIVFNIHVGLKHVVWTSFSTCVFGEHVKIPLQDVEQSRHIHHYIV